MNDFVELRSVIVTVLRHWWMVLLGALLFGVLGFFTSSTQAPVFRATTSLFVGRPIESAQLDRFDIQNSQQLAQIYADIARRQPVLQRTVESLGLVTSWGELRNRVKTQVSSDTQLLDISVEASSREEAIDTADEIARQLILVSPNGFHDADREQAREFTRQQLERLQRKIEDGQTLLEEYEVQLMAEDEIDEITVIQNEMSAVDAMVARWEANYAQLLSFLDQEQPANNLAVLEPAQGGFAPVRPKVRFNTLIAALVGMALAVGLIFLRQLLDNSLKTPAELQRLLGVRTLGAINQIKGQTPHDALVVNHDAFSSVSEDYRLLRTKLQFMYDDNRGHTIMVTSPERGNGKSLTVANLGIVLAQAGLRTIIVDANLRQPTIHTLFQLPNQDGLTHLLRGREQEPERYLAATMVPNLKILTSGSPPSNPAELLGSIRMGQLLKQLSQKADVVLCDASEAVTVADASALSNQVDGVIAVIEAGKTNRDVAMQMVANLSDAHATLIGAVLNRIPSKSRLVVFSSGTGRLSRNHNSAQNSGNDLSYADSAAD